MNKYNNKIIVILGPTSSGKSDVAICLAKKFDGEIISADSRQIYRGLDVGTGKIAGALRSVILSKACTQAKSKNLSLQKVFISENIPHYMIDIVSPRTSFSAASFKKKADGIIVDILKRGKLPIICGGTGFWIKAIVDNITYPEVKPDWKLRDKLSNKSAEELFLMLEKLDPERAGNIDAKNKVRLIRAIEICEKLGKVPSPQPSPKGRGSSSSSPLGRGCHVLMTGEGSLLKSRSYDFLQIGIDIPKEKLHENIKKRLEKRFQAGMIEEVKKLKKQGLSFRKIQSFGLGYFWIPLYLQGKMSKEELFEKVYLAEKDYAKRQMTWFKRDKSIIWISNFKEAYNATKPFLR